MKTTTEILSEINALRRQAENPSDAISKAFVMGQINALEWVLAEDAAKPLLGSVDTGRRGLAFLGY